MIPYNNLKKLVEYSITANNPHMVEWLCMIAAHESRSGDLLVQVGGGAARGICQVELATEGDNWLNWIRFKKPLRQIIAETSGVTAPSAYNLTYNHIYNIQMAWVWLQRQLIVHHLQIPETDELMALYAKKLYNTEGGKATKELYLEAYRCAISS